MSEQVTYKDSGVDIDAGNKAVELMKEHVKKTHNANVLANIGSFGGLFKADFSGMKNPVLVSSCDGVGTKLKVAYKMKKHDTIGQDLVNHCIDDIMVMGAKPLFFLDYIGTGKMDPEAMAEIVKGFSIAAEQSGVAIVGGESAEMPGIYNSGEYDVAGFIVGVVDKEKIITGESIKEGDIMIGLPSNGIHTNGYSLINKLFAEKLDIKFGESVLGDELLRVHKCYLNEVSPLLETGIIKGMAHITGGGFYDNIPRILPKDVNARVSKSSWAVPEIFDLIQKEGNVPEEDMYRTFNMGIGLVIIISKEDLDTFEATFNGIYYKIGEIVNGECKTEIVD